MFTYCLRHATRIKSSQFSSISLTLLQTRGRCSASRSDDLEEVRTLLQLCEDRYYISPGHNNTELFRRGVSCTYGPLGLELRRNLLQHWWDSVTRSRVQVFGINTLSSSGETDEGGHLKMVQSENLLTILQQQELSKEQIVQEVQKLLQRSLSVRESLLQGALDQFVPSLQLVNRKLPFGLAETGLCFQPSDTFGCPAEVFQTSLVWFCSPRTSSQWLDHWTRQRLKWWRNFALSPSDFSSSDVPEEELVEAASRGVRITYNFPWGQETLETLWSRGDAELLRTYNGVRSKLQLLKRENNKQRLQQRKVLKLHPMLAPVKVSLDINRGATMELRQVCEGLLQEFMDAKISVWPGYLETMPTSMEQLNAKYDEMGVLFTAVISENTLESGLLQVRNRDTAVKETMHISEIKNFLSRYISATDKI